MILDKETIDLMVNEYEGQSSADHVYGLLCDVAKSHEVQRELLANAKDFVLELLVHADQPLSEESKGKARAFVKALDEKVKNGQQQPT